ncbi:MAG: Do family serine endopeptidase [Buchnera aphidicola (Nurudea ibofushi)]
MTLILRIISTFSILLLIFGFSWKNPVFRNNVSNLESTNFGLASMLEEVLPSVVSIDIEGNTIVQQVYSPYQFQSFCKNNNLLCKKNVFLKKFQRYQTTYQKNSLQERFHALGSGVIINAKKGYVVTNNHVINNATKIQVQLSNGHRYNAKIVGKDSRFDIALIQLEEVKNLKEIKISDSNLLRVGDSVIAIGNPYGLGETVTSGIVSALNRNGLNVENYENFIQTDAAINRGNSGGALVNLKGELIGINTAILTPDSGNVGIGFAIPSNVVTSLTNQMIAHGQVYRNELGITGVELSSDLAKAMRLHIHRGAFVSRVVSKSSADIAGIKPGDVIISLNKKPIFDFLSLRAEIAALPANTSMELGLLRDGYFKIVKVELKLRTKNKVESINLHLAIEGAELSDFYFNNHKKGIYVENVIKDTAAFRIGFKNNDVIVGANKCIITCLDDFKKLLSSNPEILVFKVRRGSEIVYLLTQD